MQKETQTEEIIGFVAVADLENFGEGDDKIYEHKLYIISKFCMVMINVLDLAQTCWGYF